MKNFTLVSFVLAAAVASGCNVFDPLDSPTGDDQLLSAARAALDGGDVAKAREYYAKISTSQPEVAASEQAFATLQEVGLGMAQFADAIGNGGGGGSVTILADNVTSQADATLRLKLFNAYRQIDSITTNAPLRGLVRFTTSLALFSEIMAEQGRAVGTATILEKNDVATNGASCAANGGSLACAALPACAAPGASVLTFPGASDLSDSTHFPTTGVNAGKDTWTTSDFSSTNPSYGMLQGLIRAIDYALKNELNSSGKLSQGLGSFITVLLNQGLSSQPCYNYGLVQAGVGN